MFRRTFGLVLAIFGSAGLLAGQGIQDAAPPGPAPARAPGPVPEAVAPPAAPADREAGEKEPAEERPSEEQPAPAAGPFSLDEQIRRLGHESFKERTAAQEALLEWGGERLDESIEALYEVYRTSDDPEVRLRSRQVLRRLVIVKQPFDGEGYLGIQMDTNQVRNQKGELQMAVLVTEVREGTAAEAAKLQQNDLITGVDGIVFDDLAPTRAFADYIKSRKPGDVITLRVQRGAESLELTASLRRRSPLLNRLSQWGTELDLPPQQELDEADFQDWLRMRKKGAK